MNQFLLILTLQLNLCLNLWGENCPAGLFSHILALKLFLCGWLSSPGNSSAVHIGIYTCIYIYIYIYICLCMYVCMYNI